MYPEQDRRLSPRAVLVAHREQMVAEGLAAALARYPGIGAITVTTTAADAEEQGERVHAVALDEHLPGAELAALCLRRNGVRVVTLGEESEEEDLRVPMRASVAHLAEALVPGIAWTKPAITTLSPRERQVLSLVARGLAGKQVARHLGISPKTVEQHKTRIYSKLGVPNQTAAVSFAFSSGGAAGVGGSHL